MTAMKSELERIFRAGVTACQPESVLPPHFAGLDGKRILVLAVGKAAGGMAAAAERHFGDKAEGLAVLPHGLCAPLERMVVARAGHPLPDGNSVEAAERLIALASEAQDGDLVLVLLSGGASALACLPGAGLSLADKKALTDRLLRSGAAIDEINAVRRHLSRIKGGRLGQAVAPARLVTLAISDVVGDRPETIGSGPTAADPLSLDQAKAVLVRYGIEAPAEGWSETAKEVTGDYRIVACNGDALAAAAAEARRLGFEPRLIEDEAGEARDAGRRHSEVALGLPPGTALISGGEVVVTVRGRGRGGPSQEYALGAALALAGRSGIFGLAADTDGIDGRSEAAGAFFDGGTIARFRGDPRSLLEANDSGRLFETLGDLLVTGPTGTNVNDLRIMLTAH